MAGEQVLKLPTFVWALKIVQAVFAILLLAFAAYQLSVVSWSGAGVMLWSALYSIIALTYYFVAVHFVPGMYNWIALLVLECFSVIWWLVSWALMAAAVAGAFAGSSYDYYYYYDSYWYRKRDIVKRDTVTAFWGVLIASLTFALINWILYIITLVFVAKAVHQVRKEDGSIAMSRVSHTSAPASEPKPEAPDQGLETV